MVLFSVDDVDMAEESPVFSDAPAMSSAKLQTASAFITRTLFPETFIWFNLSRFLL